MLYRYVQLSPLLSGSADFLARRFAVAFFFARGFVVLAGAASSLGAGVSCLTIGASTEAALATLGLRLARTGAGVAAATGAETGVGVETDVGAGAGVETGAGVCVAGAAAAEA